MPHSGGGGGYLEILLRLELRYTFWLTIKICWLICEDYLSGWNAGEGEDFRLSDDPGEGLIFSNEVVDPDNLLFSELLGAGKVLCWESSGLWVMIDFEYWGSMQMLEEDEEEGWGFLGLKKFLATSEWR